MDEPPREPLTVWQFLLRHVAWIAIGSLLLFAVGGVLVVWLPYQREQRIARMIESSGGNVEYRYCGPGWIPESVAERLSFLSRIELVCGLNHAVSAELISELRSLTYLETLDLGFTQITDSGLEHLKGLTNLKLLSLNNTQITDEGLKHLKGMTSLNMLALNNTQITDEGLKHLKGMTSLQTLTLQNTKVTDAGLEHLKGLSSLQFLLIDNTQVTAEGRAMLRKALPGCTTDPSLPHSL